MPSKPGVYLYLDKNKEIIYVGKAKDLKSRVSSYFTGITKLGPKTQILVDQIAKIKVVVVESELESLLLEAFYIKKFKPRYNIRLADDKSYPFIKITLKDEYPTVLFAHKKDDSKAAYFGPYPSSGSVKLVLRTLRKAFPFQSVKNHPKRVCLYNHLGLCPCPPVFSSAGLRREYKKNIHNIIRVLEGKSQIVVKNLKDEMNKKSKAEEFEEAAKIKNQLDALKAITEPAIKPFEYDINPNLRVDLRKSELRGLKSALSASGLKVNALQRIECYDISNTQGTNATGSLVVLTEGEIDKSQYRKFRIKKSGKPDDFGMMAEMLTRRLKRKDWPDPDLIVVDGGKGQLSAILGTMSEFNKSYPVIGLAKREETIVVPTFQDSFVEPDKKTKSDTYNRHLYGLKEENFREISLSKKDPVLHLVQRIRNEAHRFAITYHRNLRSKAALKNDLLSHN